MHIKKEYQHAQHVVAVALVLLSRMTPTKMYPLMLYCETCVDHTGLAAASVVDTSHSSLMQCVSKCMSLQQNAFCAKPWPIDNTRDGQSRLSEEDLIR